MVAARPPDAAPAASVGDRPAGEQTRARYPDESGFVERDGVRVFWERYGDGGPTILLLPTWSIIHSRHWKFQIPFLARSFRVVTLDGRGNGRSDRPPDPAAYADTEVVADAVAVLDAVGADRAVIAGLSMGGGYALRMAADHPDRVLGAVFIGPAVALGSPDPGREHHPFDEELDTDEGWAKYNAHAWRRDWPGFVEWFFGQVFSESHSTKHIEDALDWGLDTDPETIITAEAAPYGQTRQGGRTLTGRAAAEALAARVQCPCLVIHGTADRIIPYSAGEELATRLGAQLVRLEGSGHSPIGREPVLTNLLIRDFVRSIAGEAPS